MVISATLSPTATGTYQQLYCAISHLEAVTDQDGDEVYGKTIEPPQKYDTFIFSASSIPSCIIEKVRLSAYVRIGTSGAGNLDLVTYFGGTLRSHFRDWLSYGQGDRTGTRYVDLTTNPAGNAWSRSDLGNIEFGVGSTKGDGGGEPPYVDKIYITVYFTPIYAGGAQIIGLPW